MRRGLTAASAITRAEQRRRQVMRAGLAALSLLTAGAASACIFDDGGDYQGGGRLGRIGTAQQDSSGGQEPPPPAPDPTPAPTPAPDAGTAD